MKTTPNEIKYHKQRITVLLILITVSMTMTIAYSTNLSSILYTFGTINLDMQEGTLEITSITEQTKETTNATNNGYTITVKEGSTNDKYTLITDFDVEFYRTTGSSTTSITYNINIVNNSFQTMVLNDITSSTIFTEGENTLKYTISGANIGTTVLKYGEETTIKLTLSLASTERNTKYVVKQTFEYEFLASTSSLSLFAALSTQSVLLNTTESIEKIPITIINNSDYYIEYNITTDNSNFQIIDENQEQITNLKISPNTTENINVYIRLSNQHILENNINNINIKLKTTSPLILTYDIGTLQVTTPESGIQKVIEDETIYDDNTINFTQTSTTSGIFKNSTNNEITYFYRGNVDNNYVDFAGLTWRIIRIDKYGTRIILDSTIDETSAWADTNIINTTSASTDDEKLTLAKTLLSYENSKVKTILDNWYTTNLTNYTTIIKKSVFCEDYTYKKLTSSGSYNETYYFGSYIRNGKDSDGYTPEFICTGTNATEKYYNIGLISADELAFAGALFNSTNTNFYLYNSNISSIWWTMSASYYDTKLNTVGIFIYNGSNGKFYDWENGSTIANTYSIRPVITLDTERLSGGTGTINDKYKFE